MTISIDYLNYQLGEHLQNEDYILSCAPGAHKPISYAEHIPVFRDDSEFLDRIQATLDSAGNDLIVCSINTSGNNLHSIKSVTLKFRRSPILFLNSSCTGSFEFIQHLVPKMQNGQYEGITYITVCDRARHIHSGQANILNWYGDGYGELRLSNSVAGREMSIGKTVVDLASTCKDQTNLDIRTWVRMNDEYAQYQRKILISQISQNTEVNIGLPYLDEGNAEYFRGCLRNRIIQPSIQGLAWLPGLHWLVTLKDNYDLGKVQVLLQGYGYSWSSVQVY